jgi:hypothetical protein
LGRRRRSHDDDSMDDRGAHDARHITKVTCRGCSDEPNSIIRPYQCPDSDVRQHSRRALSELRSRRGTGNFMILVPLLNPKFATVPAEKSYELPVRGSRRTDWSPVRDQASP